MRCLIIRTMRPELLDVAVRAVNGWANNRDEDDYESLDLLTHDRPGLDTSAFDDVIYWYGGDFAAGVWRRQEGSYLPCRMNARGPYDAALFGAYHSPPDIGFGNAALLAFQLARKVGAVLPDGRVVWLDRWTPLRVRARYAAAAVLFGVSVPVLVGRVIGGWR